MPRRRGRVRVRDKVLTIGRLNYDIRKFRDIYVVGAGKATFSIAKALDETLNEHISEGVVIVKKGQGSPLKRVEVLEAEHPLPDEAGMAGARKIKRIAQRATRGDLVFCLVTGGASALMPLPVQGVSLQDKRRIT